MGRIVYANIGSNLGDREKFIEKALGHIGEFFGFYCVSGVMETYSWGYDSSLRFLNIGVAFKSDLHPEEILRRLQDIEKMVSGGLHRDEEGRYCDRELDIDIMAFDTGDYRSPQLIVPHVHLKERDFFLLPLQELSPGWKDPSTGETLEEILRQRHVQEVS